MDRTVLFKASVKTIRTRNKALGVKDIDKGSTILPARSKVETDFGSKAKDVLVNIRKLRDFLMDHRKNYIDPTRPLTTEMSSMTDAERDQIDKDAETYMRTCNASIKALKNEVSKQAVPEQVKTHRDTAVELLEKYLKIVCKLYSEQRAIRVKRVVDKKRISRLQPEKRHRQSVAVNQCGESEAQEEKSKLLTEEKQPVVMQDNYNPPADYDEELSSDEVQMFEQENKKLFEEMNSLVDEVRQIEGRVVEISRLQEIFSDKVLQQTHQIDRLYETSVGTTENVTSGNEQIREAIKNNASFRVWILFFLVMCSFSLLFLDWYS